MRDVTLPNWLEELVDRVNAYGTQGEWPDDRYPALAFKALSLASDAFADDGVACLVQLLINEVERLQKRIGGVKKGIKR